MNTARDRLTYALRDIGQSWLTWLLLGALAGAALFFGTEMSASDAALLSPSAIEIDQAVAQAQDRANAIQATGNLVKPN